MLHGPEWDPLRWELWFRQLEGREGGFLALSGELVGGGHGCLCKWNAQASKRGLIFLGFQCNHSGLKLFEHNEWSSPQSHPWQSSQRALRYELLRGLDY